MYACMYVLMYLCTYMCYVSTNVYPYLHVNTCMYVCIDICMYRMYFYLCCGSSKMEEWRDEIFAEVYTGPSVSVQLYSPAIWSGCLHFQEQKVD